MGAATALDLKRDAIELLNAEYRALDQLLDRFESLDTGDGRRVPAAAEIGLRLTYLTMLEEDVFLPAVEAAVSTSEGRRAIEIARLENALTNTLVERSESMRDDAPHLDAVFSVLIPLVRRHMSAQRDNLFPMLRDAGIDFRSMATRISARRAEIEHAVGGGRS